MTLLYKLENVSKIYSQRKVKKLVLNQINLAIEKGKIIAIVGPSGSGKSTLLNILAGIETISCGYLYFQNQLWNQLSLKKQLQYRRNYMGFVFQNYNLIPNLTVKENIELGANVVKKRISIAYLLKEMDLEIHKNKYPYQLSGGEQQRVSIARACAKNPLILFCDEPTGSLDGENEKRVLDLLKKINQKRGTTILIVTHSIFVTSIADIVFQMENGKIGEYSPFR